MKRLRMLKEKIDRRIIAAACFLAAAAPLCAQSADLPGKMNTIAGQILAIMTGAGVKVLLACFLAGSAVAYAFNKDNEKVKRNCIAVGVAAAILIMAQTLVNWIVSIAGS